MFQSTVAPSADRFRGRRGGSMRIAFPSEDEVAAKDFIGFAALSRTLFPPLCSRIVLKTTLTAGGTPRQRRMERRPPADLLPFIARNHARQAKPDRALAPLSMLATLAPPAANAAWRGRGAEEKVRGAEPSGGFAARRRKRAGRGYMLPFARVEHGLPLRQRTLPPMPEQRNTSRTEPSA